MYRDHVVPKDPSVWCEALRLTLRPNWRIVLCIFAQFFAKRLFDRMLVTEYDVLDGDGSVAVRPYDRTLLASTDFC